MGKDKEMSFRVESECVFLTTLRGSFQYWVVQ